MQGGGLPIDRFVPAVTLVATCAINERPPGPGDGPSLGSGRSADRGKLLIWKRLPATGAAVWTWSDLEAGPKFGSALQDRQGRAYSRSSGKCLGSQLMGGRGVKVGSDATARETRSSMGSRIRADCKTQVVAALVSSREWILRVVTVLQPRSLAATAFRDSYSKSGHP
jgi:hypothetical protein